MRVICTTLVTIVAFFATCGITAGAAQPPPQTIGAYGDSITAGFLSGTNVTHSPSLEEISGVLTALGRFAFGNKTDFQKLHAPELAWPAQLGKMWGVKTVNNYAVSKSHVEDVFDQISRAPGLSKNQTSASFIFIGHNDICRGGTDAESFERSFYEQSQRNILEWDKKHEKAALYLVPVGDINRMYKTLNGYVWHKGTTPASSLTCNDSWNRIIPLCRENIQRLREGKLTEHIESRTKAIRRVLARLAEEWNKDSRSNRIFFLQEVLTGEYKPEYFAVDCYHLSAIGEKAVATDIFNALGKESQF